MDKEMAKYFRKRQAFELKKKLFEVCFWGVFIGVIVVVAKWMD